LSDRQSILLLVKAEAISEQELKHIIGEMEKSLSASSDLLNNLLQWAKSQQKGAKTNLQHFDLNLTSDEVLSQLTPIASEKRIDLINRIPLNTFAWADQDMIRLVIRNLVSNALKFTEKGGLVEVGAKKDGALQVIEISDTGIGIAPDVMSRIFGQEHYSTRGTDSEKGTGLGLMLCKDFVELNDGHIGVSSELDKGSVFWFKIPKDDRQKSREELTTNPHELNG